ncbi:unnamed protein product [Caenorhabditis brenneri]
MVVAYFNSTNDSFWIPTYSINDRVYRESGILFTIFAFFQISLYVFTGYVIVRTCQIFIKIKVFHENMNILMAWFLLQWVEAILAKIVIIPYQIGLISIGIDEEQTFYGWWASNPKDMVIVREDLYLVYIHFNALVFVGLRDAIKTSLDQNQPGYSSLCSNNQACAVFVAQDYFSVHAVRDYEHVRRRHIPILLILTTNLITLPYAYETTTNRISLLFTCVQCFLNASIVFFGYLVLRRVNLIWRNRISSPKYSHNEKYSLARKFQIEENIRSLLLARKLVISAVIFISAVCFLLICLVFELTHGYDTFFVYALDNSILLPALVMSITLLFCWPAWRQKFIDGIPGTRRFRGDSKVAHLAQTTTKSSAVRETEVYFEQLQNAWNA